MAAGTLMCLPLTRPVPFITEIGVYARRGWSLPVAPEVFVALIRDQLAAAEAADLTSARAANGTISLCVSS